MMKKLLALSLALMMALLCTAALAEDAMPFEGTYLEFSDYGFSMCLPNDWNVMEVPDDSAEAGFFFIAASPDGARSVQMQYTELETAVDGIDALVAELSASYEGVTAVNINGVDFASFQIPDNDINVMAAMGGAGIGLYCFYFTPASDEDFGPIANAIASSFTPDAAE